jgi:hypothetical protein
MFDLDAFVTALYVTVDEFCKARLSPEPPCARGPAPALCRSEVLTLCALGQFARFRSERDFWRFARRRLLHLFPGLPERSRFNRLQRRHALACARFALGLAHDMDQSTTPFEVLDRLGVATRWCGRRGAGWLPEADKGYCARLGYFHGLHLLSAVTASGVITGIAVAPASAKDQPLASALLHARAYLTDELPFVGLPAASGHYALDKGFTGADLHRAWRAHYGVAVLCAPQASPKRAWPKSARRWLASVRQIVESVHDKLLNAFRLARERPHDYEGFCARLFAKVALHNFCLWLNRQHGRPSLAFADLIDW